MSERETDRTAPWMLNHCANLKHGSVQSGVLVSACDWCAKYADPLCAMARPGGPDEHDWPAGCSCARRHNVAVPVSRAAGGETEGRAWSIIRDAMMRACRAEREEQTTERFIAMIDAFAAKCEQELRALSSAPAPEERTTFAWVIVDSRYPAPNLRYYNGVGSNEYGQHWTPDHLQAIRFARKSDAYGVILSLPDGLHLVAAAEEHGWLAPAPSPPSGAGSPVAGNHAIVSVLMGHWLTAVECDHDAKTDKAACFCGWASAALSTVGDAVCAWAEHVASHAAPPAAGREPSEAEVERGVEGWRAWEHNGREDDETVVAMVRAILRAALGASAQTNTGEAR